MAQETHSTINSHVLFFALGMATGAIKVGRGWMRTMLKDVVACEEVIPLNQRLHLVTPVPQTASVGNPRTDFLHVVEFLTLHVYVYFPRCSIYGVLHESVNKTCPAVTFGTVEAIMRGIFVRLVGSLHIVTERAAELWMLHHFEVGRAKDDYGEDNQSCQNHHLDNNACQDKQRPVFSIYTSFSKIKHVVTPLKLWRGLPHPYRASYSSGFFCSRAII
jgi:hypothetical protein